ncbi:BglG family transcription antiterminator [Faecalibaculum rodentium]|uniref:BglG family transcription antiterminator n=1 Tax=Faecalibaculum rodentium TaxID=1702221 RepID=UPI00261449BD|nr:PRD domain-containing protein [Faecalibaculum rodentium]
MNNQTENRMARLWKLLDSSPKPMRLDAAALALDVSEKTIRRDLIRLNELLQDADSSVKIHKGTFVLEVPSRDAVNALFESQTGIPDTQAQRVDWLAAWFLMNGTATVQSLADRLYISESTVKNDLNVLKNELKPFHLTLTRCSEGLRLSGPEEQIRNCLIYWTRSGKIRPDFGFDEASSQLLSDRIRDLLEAEGACLDEYGIQNLLLHLKIAANRIRSGRVLTGTDTVPQELWQLASAMTQTAGSIWSLEFPLGETENLAWHIAAQKQSGALHIDEEEYRMLLSALKTTLQDADALYGTQLAADPVLLNGLTAHLSVVLVRLHHGMVIDNPILKEIRSQYPYAMEIAQLAATGLQEMLGCRFPLTEIGFLAVHIGGSLVRTGNSRKSRQKAAVVCTTGMGTSLLLLARISERFGQDLDVTGTFTIRQAAGLTREDADVILSTVRLPREVTLPWLQITPLMTDRDMAVITDYLKKTQFAAPVQSLFHPSLYFPDLNLDSRSEILAFLSEQLYRQGWIDKTARESFAKRESLGTTEIGNMVAVPHCMEGTVRQPAVAVAILTEPVLWEFGPVQVVCMIAVSHEFLRKENGFFLRFYRRLASPALIRTMIQTRHPDLLKDAFDKEDTL